MTQVLIQELQITPTTLRATLKRAAKSWNAKFEKKGGDKVTVREFLVNILCYWDIVTHQEWKKSELVEAVAELLRDGTPGYGSLSEDELLVKVLSEGVVGQAVEDGKSLCQLLDEHPWITWEEN